MSLATKALLVTLKISQWTGRKLDKTATGTVESTHATQKAVGNYTKKLLPGAKELEELQRQAGAIRAWFYEQTLPWLGDGTRILKSSNYMPFTTDFRAKQLQLDRATADFMYQYPTLCEAARAKLGDLFRESEYPSEAYLRKAFACEVSFMPIPDVADFRVEILDSEKREFLQRMADIESSALRDCWNRMHEVVARAAGKLHEPDAIFRDSLIENVREMCALLPRLNVTDDAELESMRRAVESAVANVTPEAIRAAPVTRAAVARSLDDITAKMSAFMGAA